MSNFVIEWHNIKLDGDDNIPYIKLIHIVSIQEPYDSLTHKMQ